MSKWQRIGLAWLIINMGVYKSSDNGIVVISSLVFVIIGMFLLIKESK